MFCLVYFCLVLNKTTAATSRVYLLPNNVCSTACLAARPHALRTATKGLPFQLFTQPRCVFITAVRGRGGTREEPGTLTQGGALFSLVHLVWESNPELQGGWCKPNHQPIGGSDPNSHQGIWSPPRAGL